MRIAIITAFDENRIIGRGNGLPWPRIKEDMRHFRRTTLGYPVVMGRKTFESIGSRPLPMRTNIVLTRDLNFSHPDCEIVNDYRQILNKKAEKIFIIGGASVYEQFLPHAKELHLTQIGGAFQGDSYFPEIMWPEWRMRSEKITPIDAENRYPLRFTVWERLLNGNPE